MDAKKQFDDAIRRAKDLIHLHDTCKNDDALRMAVALGVAALDMYSTERFLSGCIPYIRKTSDDDKAAEFLESIGFKLADAVALLKNPKERPLRHVRTSINKVHEKDVLQKFDKIDKYFLLFGIQNFSSCVFKKIGASARKKLERMIARRHDIVHDADCSSWNRVQKIEKRTVSNWIDYVERYVNVADMIVENALKKKGCHK